jgi:hypothetical protein
MRDRYDICISSDRAHPAANGCARFFVFYYLKSGLGDAKMRNEPRLPRNKKEGYLFLLIVSVISVNLIAPAIMFSEVGLSLAVYKQILQVLPLMWLIVVLMVKLVAQPLVGRIAPRLIAPTDSFNVQVLATIVLNVTIMSTMLTVVGPWVGTRHISMEPIREFFLHWPRNFGIAFGVEVLIAQPIARFVMKAMHRVLDRANAQRKSSLA